MTGLPAWLPLRDDLRGLTPYGAPQIDVPVRLNTNENPHPPSAALVAALGEAATAASAGLNRYPDREAALLRTELAEFLTVESAAAGQVLTPGQVWAANGSNEILQQLCQAFGGQGRTALGFEPSYSMHRLIALGTGTAWADGGRDDDFALRADRVVEAIRRFQPSLVFLCSPNNPTGTAVPLELVQRVHDVAEQAIVVVDEAYAEFRHTGVRSAVTLLPGAPRLVVTRTMSKAFALAGARVGYLAAAPEIVDALRLVRLPYHLSALTQAAARTALRHRDELLGTVAAVREQRDRLVAELPVLGCWTAPSDANFVFFSVDGDSAAVWQKLLDRGVLVRDVGIPGWLRVTAGLPHEVDAFLQALEEVLLTVPRAPSSSSTATGTTVSSASEPSASELAPEGTR
ncbi:MAG TPA: histidinol-phosphate transaminase [Frankiaceae bacterium]|nr:histidinol-phosphate transaminase [Frankiaceae bacterium]